MKIVIALSALLLASATLSGCAAARAGDKSERREARIEKFRGKFQSADTNHDDFLSRDEAANGMPRLAAHFDDADSDHDGKLSMSEAAAYVAQARAQRGK